MISPYLVVAEAREWLDPPTRWQHQARLKGVATDCFGLILGVGLALKIPGAAEAAEDYALRGYGREPDYEVALTACRRYMLEIQKEYATIGDVLYLRVPRGIQPQHFAIKTADYPPYMIHAWAKSRGVVENRIDEAWQSRIVHAFRYRDVA